MNDKSKLIVFDRKEVVLVFVFILFVAVTSFTLGIKMGKMFNMLIISLNLVRCGRFKEQ